MTITNQSQQTQTKLKLSSESISHHETGVLFQQVHYLPTEIQELVKSSIASFSEVRDGRVQTLRDQIVAGAYQVDSTKLAKKILGL